MSCIIHIMKQIFSLFSNIQLSFILYVIISLSLTNAYQTENFHLSSNNNKAIIIGGGPTGLAAALTLANSPHNYNVNIYESNVDGGRAFDFSKSFVYNVNSRGQRWTSLFPFVQSKLEKQGIGKLKGVVVVPADETKRVPEPTSTNVNSSTQKMSYWIPRHEFISLLHEAIDEHEQTRIRNNNTSKGAITFHKGHSCVDLCFMGDPKQITPQSTVVVSLKDEESLVVYNETASLVIGADGINSKVRDCLRFPKQSNSFNYAVHYDPSKFKLTKWSSPATGLRFKALQLPMNFTISQEDGSFIDTTGDTMYAIRSRFSGPRNYLSLGILPHNSCYDYRPANCITRENHEIWDKKDGESLRIWFEQSFPRMPFKKNDNMVSDQEWERLAKAPGARFPYCQYSRGLSATSSDGHCGVALIGDAVHAFPPDIGQGVNAGLEDINALSEALSKVNHVNQTIGQSLIDYERRRIPEIHALIRLARFGSPYQYRQPDVLNKIGRIAWSWNVLIRLLLNKVTVGLFPTPSIILAQDDSLSFREVMRRADRGTAVLTAALFVVALKLIKIFLP